VRSLVSRCFSSPLWIALVRRSPRYARASESFPEVHFSSRGATGFVGILELQEARWSFSRARPKCGGLCVLIEKSERIVVGEKVHLNFLTPEGRIRTDAIVRHVRPERLGLKFIAISEEDRAHLTALMTRLRNLSRP
jgi:hypothetical protein